MAMANTVNIVDQAASEEAPEIVVVAAGAAVVAAAVVVVLTVYAAVTTAESVLSVPAHPIAFNVFVAETVGLAVAL